MVDDSGVSLSASDPNPSIDQIDDGGSSSDFSSNLSSVAQWGTEIAAMVTGRSVSISPSGTAVIGPVPSVTPPMSPTTKLLIVAVLVAGGVALFHYWA